MNVLPRTRKVGSSPHASMSTPSASGSRATNRSRRPMLSNVRFPSNATRRNAGSLTGARHGTCTGEHAGSRPDWSLMAGPQDDHLDASLDAVLVGGRED